MEAYLKDISRREFFSVCSRDNLKHIFGAMKGFEEGVKEKTRRSCDEVGKMFFQSRTKKMNLRKEG